MALRRQREEQYNPHEEQAAIPLYDEYACSGVLTSPKRGRKPGGMEESQAMRVLLRADTLPVDPMPGDKLVIDGVEWTVARNDQVKPANRNILHKLELRP
jgi:hypothetical protein